MKQTIQFIKTFLSYYKPQKTLFILDMIAAFLVAVCDLFYPMITRNIINVYVPGRQLRLFLVWCGALLLIYLVKAALNYFIQYYGHLVGVYMQADMRRDIFRHIQKLPFSFFDENKTGSLMSRIVNDLMEVAELAHHGPEDLFISLVMLLGSFVILSTIDLPLTIIIFLVLPVIVLVAARMRLRMAQAFTRSREETAAINAEIENSISGIRVAKAFANGAFEEEKFARRTDAFVKARTLVFHTMAQFGASMSFFIDLLTLLAMGAAGLFVFFEKINIGDFAAYLLYISMFTSPIRRLVQFIEQYQDGMSGFKRFTEIMATPTEEDLPGAALPQRVEGDIRFEDVSFAYGEEGQQVLSHVDLHIPAGKTVALVGPSGGGKTTLCHLIPRFYTPSEGRILLDGADVAGIDAMALRRNIGIVQQDVFLFTGTIRENIAYGDLAADEEAVRRAAQRAGLAEFIESLPQGYDTYIGERGVKLSGGQKQRISIARVFLKDPPVLILDEATSALDNITEMAIQQSFDELAAGRTTLVVAHRLSTVKNADEIVVLSESGVEEQGTHQQLMEKGGAYRALYETQFRADAF